MSGVDIFDAQAFEAELYRDPKGTIDRYGAAARALPEVLSGEAKAAAASAATAGGAAACLATGLAAPVCALGVALLGPAIAAALDELGGLFSGGEGRRSTIANFPDPPGHEALSAREWAWVIESSATLERAEREALARLARAYERGAFQITGQKTDGLPDAKRLLAVAYGYPPIEITKPFSQNPADCGRPARSTSDLTACAPGNDLWQRIVTRAQTHAWGTADHRPEYERVRAEIKDRASKLGGAVIKATSLLADDLTVLALRFAEGQKGMGQAIKEASEKSWQRDWSKIGEAQALETEIAMAAAERGESAFDAVMSHRAEVGDSFGVGSATVETRIPAGSAALLLGGFAVLFFVVRNRR